MGKRSGDLEVRMWRDADDAWDKRDGLSSREGESARRLPVALPARWPPGRRCTSVRLAKGEGYLSGAARHISRLPCKGALPEPPSLECSRVSTESTRQPGSGREEGCVCWYVAGAAAGAIGSAAQGCVEGAAAYVGAAGAALRGLMSRQQLG